MPRLSAGLLVYRHRAHGLEFLLAHPGGPLFTKKDEGAWSIPKGELNPGEDLFTAAQREFAEEIGQVVTGEFIPLSPITQKNGKIVHAWAIEADLDVASVKSNFFTMEWPPKSGKQPAFPEIDRAEYFSADMAAKKIRAAQWPLVEELMRGLRTL